MNAYEPDDIDVRRQWRTCTTVLPIPNSATNKARGDPAIGKTKRTHEPQNPQAYGIVFDDILHLSFVEQIHALSSMIRGK